MNFTVGTRIGPYEITSPLSEGGMGVVYRAHDTKLGRDVAIKALPDAFAKDSDRLLRFQREAQVLASLNHPNIAQIYGLEESDIAQGQGFGFRSREGPERTASVQFIELADIAECRLYPRSNTGNCGVHESGTSENTAEEVRRRIIELQNS